MAPKARQQSTNGPQRPNEVDSDPARAVTTDGDHIAPDPHATHAASDSVARDLHGIVGSRRQRDPSLPIATQLRDPSRYRVIGEHGRGGLGKVSRALDRDLDRDVAIKELIHRTPISEARFLREALITARLEHPGIVPVHEAGRWPDGTPFYAMKLVAGRPLRDLIAERTTIVDRLALLHHVIAVADALAYAHGRNIIHRDLKPANVIVGDFGETIVIDWGLAKDLNQTGEEVISADETAHARTAPHLTVAGSVLGTPAYMAPEQERGEPVDQRADVFAIGAMLWELCSLQKVPPEERKLRHRMLRASGIERDLVTIIDKALERDPRRRYAGAGALAADLKSFKAGALISARRYSAPERVVRWGRRHRALTVALLATAVAILIGLPLYVRDISAEQERTAAALATANWQREHAIIAQASLLLEKDPTKSIAILDTVRAHSAQYALLAARARQRAAKVVVPIPGGIRDISMSPDGTKVAVVNRYGELYQIDARSGERTFVAGDISGSVAWQREQLVYLRRAPTDKQGAITGLTGSATRLVPSTAAAIALRASQDAIYSLHADGVLYRHEADRSEMMATQITAFAASKQLLVTCSASGVLEAHGAGPPVAAMRCMPDARSIALAASGNNYVVRTDTSELMLWRRGQASRIKLTLPDLFELSVSTSGVAAGVGYGASDSAWFIRPGSEVLELAPKSTASLSTVATDGQLVAWGYEDGGVVVLDTRSNQSWKLVGHPGGVSFIAINAAASTLVTTSENELRVWHLEPQLARRIAAMTCTSFNLQLAPGGGNALFDCSDGSVYAWSPPSGKVTQIQRHDDLAFGVQWLQDAACSAGWDGRVICSASDGKAQQTFDTHSGRILWMEPDRARRTMLLATVDGKVWQLDGSVLRELYSHDSSPYRLAISQEDLLASCDISGRIIVYDLRQHRLRSKTQAHAAAISSIAWTGTLLRTTGADGTLRTWRSDDHDLTQIAAVYEGDRVRMARSIERGWLANVGDSMLVVERSRPLLPFKLDLGQHVTNIDTSPNGRFALASTSNEIVVIDLVDHTVSSFLTTHSIAGFVRFLDDDQIAMSASASLESIRRSQLNPVSFEPF